jgi:aspartate carbamoyltransferase catalytic subunit
MTLLKKLVSSIQISPDFLHQVFTISDYMARIIRQRGRTDLLSDKVIALLFLEPSSRTMMSFQSAAERLQAGILFLQSKETSSLQKGESVEDTMRVTAGYCDMIVARLPKAGSAEIAANACSVPFINAGDGSNEHPTQALVDTYTIRQALGRLQDIHVALGFDPLQSRSIHSLVRVLAQFPGVRFTFISPPSLRAPDDLLNELRSRSIEFFETEDVSSVRGADVIYLNRLQEERFTDPKEFDLNRYRFKLTKAMLSDRTKLILDPLPRIDEIAPEVDDHPAASYFRQAHNGIPIRMALMCLLLDRV